MSETEKNLELWESVDVPPEKYTSDVPNQGFKCTETNPHYNIKKATELWGPMGTKWGVDDEKFVIVNEGLLQVCIYTAWLFYPDGKVPLHAETNTQKHKENYKTKQVEIVLNNDFTKKVATEALKKGMSKIGFSASIYLKEYFDELKKDNKEKEETEKKRAEEDERKKNEQSEKAEKAALEKFYAGVGNAETQEKLDVVKDWMEKSPFKNKEELRKAVIERSKRFEAQA